MQPKNSDCKDSTGPDRCDTSEGSLAEGDLKQPAQAEEPNTQTIRVGDELEKVGHDDGDMQSHGVRAIVVDIVNNIDNGDDR
ncbi:hypothetical protein [Undibacterium sp.]|uniref:hypothetical protein n=1 Tax=Undibacterium sp. TaxID=1914977 RepID=UPI0027314DDC|nr:hypothetical protein [Undibacterium sp.]MDP1979691.1 hypothetical protein [Undibacterium sp.]